MATDIAITQLPDLPAALIQGDDVLPVVDVHDLTSPTGTTKGALVSALRSTANVHNGVYTVTDPTFGADATGASDSTAAIQSALTLAGTTGLLVYLPPGTYKTTATLSIPDGVALCGVRRQSIIQPTAALSTGYAITSGSYNLIQGLMLDGSNTTGASGLGIAVGSGVNNNVICRDLDINSFAGSATARAIQFNNGVGCRFDNIYCKFNSRGVVIAGTVPTAPTDSAFVNVYVYEATADYGFYVTTGTNLHFLLCVAEACWQEGVLITSAANGTHIQNIVWDTCYFDSNWFSLNGNAARANQYSFRVTGNITNNIVITPVIRNASMNETPGTGAPKALRLTDAYNFVVDNPTTKNVSCILVDGKSFGTFSNWTDVIGGILGASDFDAGNQVVNTSTGIVRCTSKSRTEVFAPYDDSIPIKMSAITAAANAYLQLISADGADIRFGKESGSNNGFVGSFTNNIVNLYARSAVQAQLQAIASTTRWITLAGSAAGNPTLGTSAGSLAITAAIAAASTFGCNGATPQSAAASGGAVATTAPTQTTPWGFTTQAQGQAIITLLNNIRAALVANGIMS